MVTQSQARRNRATDQDQEQGVASRRDRTEHAQQVKRETDAILDEIDALLAEDEAERKRAFKEKIGSLSLGPMHCCGACEICPRGYRE